MALKRNLDMTSMFSMASMTDVIFLLLIFFMVTSTFVFPTALEINLPESSQQTAIKPVSRVYVDANRQIYVSESDSEAGPQAVGLEELDTFLMLVRAQEPDSTRQGVVAVYADHDVPYGKLVEILDLGARNDVKMILATKAAPSSAKPRE